MNPLTWKGSCNWAWRPTKGEQSLGTYLHVIALICLGSDFLILAFQLSCLINTANRNPLSSSSWVFLFNEIYLFFKRPLRHIDRVCCLWHQQPVIRLQINLKNVSQKAVGCCWEAASSLTSAPLGLTGQGLEVGGRDPGFPLLQFAKTKETEYPKRKCSKL